MRLKMAMQANTFIVKMMVVLMVILIMMYSNNQIVNEDYRIVDLFSSYLIVDRVKVDVGEERG